MKIKNIKNGYVKEVDDSLVPHYLSTKEWKIEKEKLIVKEKEFNKEGK